MKKVWFSLSCIVLLLGGCLDAEKFFLSLDLKDSTAEIEYSNIVSNSKEEDKIKDDFTDLIKMAYGDRENREAKPGKIVSARLYEAEGHLDGIARYSFKNNSGMLKEYGIERNERGDFIFDLTKENLEYTGGNGAYIEKGDKRFIRWDGKSASLEMKLKNKVFDAKNKSLLPYWLEWKKNNAK
jgi:hypothetical protein